MGHERLVAITASISSIGILCARWASLIPALLTRMVTVPNVASAWSSAASQSAASVTSSVKGSH